jgi:hypothetical protein
MVYVISYRVDGDKSEVLGDPIRVIIQAETGEMAIPSSIIEQICAHRIAYEIEHECITSGLELELCG